MKQKIRTHKKSDDGVGAIAIFALLFLVGLGIANLKLALWIGLGIIIALLAYGVMMIGLYSLYGIG